MSTKSNDSKAAKPLNPIHMAGKPKGWFNGEKYIPFNEMTNEHLQSAKIHAQRKELFFQNRACVFDQLVEAIEEEAERRGIELRDHNTEYHQKRADYKKRQKLVKAEK